MVKHLNIQFLSWEAAPTLPPHLPWVMPCLSREPQPALRRVQLRVDVGQKPVEHPTPQPSLQLQTFCAIWLLGLGREKDTGRETGEGCCSPPFTFGEGQRWLGRSCRNGTQTGDQSHSSPGLQTGGKVMCWGKRSEEDRIGWILRIESCGTSNVVVRSLLPQNPSFFQLTETHYICALRTSL